MRRLCAFAGLVLVLSLASAQPPAEVRIEPRYGIPGNVRVYPQVDPKAALSSAIRAIESGRYDYLVAHLMDADFVDARIDDRATLLEPAADAELRALRQRQQQDLSLDKRLQLPSDPPAFAEKVRQEAKARAFRQVVRDVQDKLTEDPTPLKDLRRYLREGEVAADGNTGRVRLRDVKDRQVFLKKSSDRWFVENRQQAEEKDK